MSPDKQASPGRNPGDDYTITDQDNPTGSQHLNGSGEGVQGCYAHAYLTSGAGLTR